MRILSLTMLFLLFSSNTHARTPQDAPANSQQKITIPSSSGGTIPQDAMFALGQQSGKIDDMSKRLDNIERDVKEISSDTGRLNVYASIAGVILLAIIAPLLYKGAERWLFKAPPSP
jgi:hypothetical protein